MAEQEHWKTKLTPFDAKLCLMVESLTGRPCEPKLSGSGGYFIVVDYCNHDEPEYISAVMDAVAGRIGERLVNMNDEPEAKRFFVHIKFSETKYPDLIRIEGEHHIFRYAGGKYVSFNDSDKTVWALQVKRTNIDLLMAFVGNGEMEIEKRPNGKAIFHFRNAGGCVYAHAPESAYIVRVKDGLYNVVEKEIFESTYRKL